MVAELRSFGGWAKRLGFGLSQFATPKQLTMGVRGVIKISQVSQAVPKQREFRDSGTNVNNTSVRRASECEFINSSGE